MTDTPAPSFTLPEGPSPEELSYWCNKEADFQLLHGAQEAAVKLRNCSKLIASIPAMIAEVERLKEERDTKATDLFDRCQDLQAENDCLRARVAELEAHCGRLGRGGAERYW